MTHQEFKARFLPCHKKMYYIAFRYLGNEYDADQRRRFDKIPI